MNSYLNWLGTGFGMYCLAQTTTDVVVGTQPPWWAQFGAAIIICVGVIYLMIKYLAPKLDQIQGKVDSTEKAVVSLSESVKTAFENNAEVNNRLLDLLEKYIAGNDTEHKEDEYYKSGSN